MTDNMLLSTLCIVCSYDYNPAFSRTTHYKKKLELRRTFCKRNNWTQNLRGFLLQNGGESKFDFSPTKFVPKNCDARNLVAGKISCKETLSMQKIKMNVLHCKNSDQLFGRKTLAGNFPPQLQQNMWS